MAVDISIEQLTNGSVVNKEWTGTGIFDKLISAVNKNIELQRTKGFITGEKYGDVYLGSIQSVIAQSMQYLLQEQVVEAEVALKETQNSELSLNGVKDRLLKDAEIGMINQQKLTEEDKLLSNARQREVLDAQKLLYNRQKEAFDDNKYQKIFEAQLNYNGMVFQDADNPDVLDIALETKVNDVFNRLITSTGSRTDSITQNEVAPVAGV